MNALITGGSNGIGAELAEQFANNGINILLVARDEKGLATVAERLAKTYGVKAETFAIDLSTSNAAQQVYEKTRSLAWNIDYLVNDAGFGNFGKFSETDGKKEDAMIAVNITALTQLCKLFIPGMIARKNGKILNLASTAAFQPGPLMAVYFASKAYVLSFSQAINNELKGTGVTVTALCPGPTSTGFEKAADAGKLKLFKGKLATPREVAQYGYHAMMAGKSVAIHRFSNKLLAFAVRFAPRDMATAMVRKMQQN